MARSARRARHGCFIAAGRPVAVGCDAPEMDAMTVLCKARGYIARQADTNKGTVELVTQDFDPRAIARHRIATTTRRQNKGVWPLYSRPCCCWYAVRCVRPASTAPHSFPVGFYCVSHKDPQRTPALPARWQKPRVSQRSLQPGSASPRAWSAWRQ